MNEERGSVEDGEESGEESGQRLDEHTLIELLAMVVAAYVAVIVGGDRPTWEEETVIVRRDNRLAVHWVMDCTGGEKGKIRARATLIIVGRLDAGGWWHFSSTV